MGLLVIYAAPPTPIFASMHSTFLQKVVLTIVIALCASLLVEFYKNFIQRSDREINQEWKGKPAASAHP